MNDEQMKELTGVVRSVLISKKDLLQISKETKKRVIGVAQPRFEYFGRWYEVRSRQLNIEAPETFSGNEEDIKSLLMDSLPSKISENYEEDLIFFKGDSTRAHVAVTPKGDHFISYVVRFCVAWDPEKYS